MNTMRESDFAEIKKEAGFGGKVHTHQVLPLLLNIQRCGSPRHFGLNLVLFLYTIAILNVVERKTNMRRHSEGYCWWTSNGGNFEPFARANFKDVPTMYKTERTCEYDQFCIVLDGATSVPTVLREINGGKVNQASTCSCKMLPSNGSSGDRL